MDARFGLFINSLATESKVDITFGKKYLLDDNIDLKKKLCEKCALLLIVSCHQFPLRASLN